MPSDEHDLAALRELLLAEIKRVDQVLAEREKQVNLALATSERATNKAEQEGLRAREAANEWRAAMADREKQFATRTAYDTLQSEVDYLRRTQDTSAGRRTAWVAAAGIIATLIAIGVGQIIRQGITAADVSQQISREAPWNRDRAAYTQRLRQLEAQIQHQQIEISKLQSDLRAHVILDPRK
jgi:hypothetical protein